MTPTPSVGQTVGGKYRIVRAIGEGGMGAVFEAEHVVTAKRVAIKWLHAQVAQRSEAAARLVREAQASARVRHPNVVDVYDVEREGDAVFLVMELLDGEPLSALLQDRTLPMYQVIALLLPAMRGVAAAHKQGVVHRDIKPDNIFLAREGDMLEPVPKVLDFGISKLDPRGAEQLSLTRTGGTMGTPLYMSYEQLSGVRDIDGRTDVYAFGVILYEALTGQPPFEATTYSELIVKVATQSPVPPKELRAEIPSSLGKIVMAAMARDRDARIPSLDALIRELTPYATEQGFRALTTQASLSPGAEPPIDLSAATAVLPASAARPIAAEPSQTPAPAAARPTLPQRQVPSPKRRTVLLALGSGVLLLGAAWLVTRSSGTARQDPSPSAPQPPRAASALRPEAGEPPPVNEMPALSPTHVTEVNEDWPGDPAPEPVVPYPELDAGKARPVSSARPRARSEKKQDPTISLSGSSSAPPVAVPPKPDVPKAEPAKVESDSNYRVNQRPKENEF